MEQAEDVEDVSARVLLKHIFRTEPPRTPVAPRRSSRLRASGGPTPQERRSLRLRVMRESLTRKALPPQRTSTKGGSVSFNDEDTPRHLLRNILMTEPVCSPVVHQRTEVEAEEPQPSSSNHSLAGQHTSVELSGLDLPDVTMGIAPSVTRKLSRKRPRQSLNVTAFEKRLKGGDDVGEEHEQSGNGHSSLSFSSSTSLSLKTPFTDVQTEKRGLQRRVSNRRKVTEEQFGAAVNKMEMQGASSFVGLGLSDTAYSEGFTLGLSKLGKPDITTEIIHYDTTVDAQSHATSSDGSQSEEESRSRCHYKEGETVQDSETEEGGGDSQSEVNVAASSQSEEKEEEEIAQDLQTEEGDGDSQSDVAASSQSQEEEEEIAQDLQTEEGGGDSQSEVDVSDTSQSPEEEEETAQDPQTEEGDGDSQSDVAASSQSQEEEEEEEIAQDLQTEEGGGDSQSEVDVSDTSQSPEEEEETAQDSHRISVQTKEPSAVECHSDEDVSIVDDEMAHKNSTKEDFPHSPAEDEEVEEDSDGHVSEEEEHDGHISYEAHCSGGGVMHATEADGDTSETGCSEGKSKANGTCSLNINLEIGDNEINLPEGLADEENLGCSSLTQENAELETEEDDEEEYEVPSKTPAFVRNKKVFSPIFVKKIQPSGTSENPPATSKQVRKTSRRAKGEAGLSKSYLMNVFKHFAKTRVSSDVYPVLKDVMDKFFDRLTEDLETYAVHAKRKTIEVEDVELLLKRQGHVNDKVPVEVLIEKYLRLDQRKILIPIATSGNVVIPKNR